MSSILGKYLRTIRIRKGLTEFKVARRAGMDLNQYISYENNPESTPGLYLARILSVLNLTSEEYTDFNVLAYKCIKSAKGKGKKAVNPEFDNKHVLRFEDISGLRKEHLNSLYSDKKEKQLR